jgi:hypothetical protein
MLLGGLLCHCGFYTFLPAPAIMSYVGLDPSYTAVKAVFCLAIR